MRDSTAVRRSLIVLAVAAVFAEPVWAQRVDLTGYWKDDAGGSYQIRQVGNNVFWINDGRPNFLNALFGNVEGNLLRGSWSDLPESKWQGSGTLLLRIESNDRLVRVSSSGSNYGGSVLTRVAGVGMTGTPPGATPGLPPGGTGSIVGTWNWFTGPPVLISPDGTFRQDANLGLTGKWRFDPAERVFVLVWSHGYTDRLTLTPDDQRLVQGTRLFGTRVSSAPPAPASNRPVTGLWNWFTGGPVAIFPNGTFRQAQGNLTGRWILTDPVKRQYTLIWSHGYTDYLTLSQDGMQLVSPGRLFGTRIRDDPGGGGAVTGGAYDLCANPNTLVIMDEWLSRAIPPQRPGDALRYEPWGRMVGTVYQQGVITATSKPDTELDRCHWLLRYASQMRSTNGMGTLEEYLRRRMGS